MKISNDDQRAIGLILFCVGVLAFLIGLAGHLKENYHYRGEISSTGFTIAIILAGDRRRVVFGFAEEETRLEPRL